MLPRSTNHLTVPGIVLALFVNMAAFGWFFSASFFFSSTELVFRFGIRSTRWFGGPRRAGVGIMWLMPIRKEFPKTFELKFYRFKCVLSSVLSGFYKSPGTSAIRGQVTGGSSHLSFVFYY